MFKKKRLQTSSLATRVENGELEVDAAQRSLSVRKLEAQVKKVEAEANGQVSLVDLRNTWGKVILGILIVTIIGDFVLVGLVGCGVWKFEGNSYFLNIVATEHLVQIFGLVIIVLKSLFPNHDGK
jgi:hypothetical protein